MSTVSPNPNMAQPNQQHNSDDPSVTPIKRKRGRPRKDEVPESEPNKRSKRCTVLQSPSANDSLVGQEVSCSFIGVFDAGYLLTVQVGSSGPILTGMVFDPRLSVPVSAENDIAPHLPMLGRNGFPPSVEEGTIINQGPGTAQKAEFMQLIQAKESPTIPKTTKLFLEGAATESAGLSDISMETPSKTSNGYDPTVLSLVTSSEASNVPKAISTTTEASLDVSNEVVVGIFKEADFLALKPSESSEIAQKITLTENKSTDVEASQVLEQQTLETRDFIEGNLTKEKLSQRTEEEPSEDPKVDESQPRTIC